MKVSGSVLSFICAVSWISANAAEALPVLDRVRGAALGSDYAYRQVAMLSNQIGPRLTGSPQAEAAVARIAEELKRLGLKVNLQPVWVPHWVRGEERAQLVKYPDQPEGISQKLAITALGGSVATPAEGLRAEVLVVRNYQELEVRKKEARNRIVLFEVVFDQFAADNGHAMDAYGAAVDYRANGPSAAAKHGAVAALVRSVGGADFRLPHTGALRYAQDATKIPAGALSAEDADLVARLAEKGPVTMQLVLTPQTLEPVLSHNVIADLPGSEKPDELVLVSGHLDSWDLGTGATDDAVGVAAAMGVAEVLTTLRLRPRRTLRVVAWMNEENGLCGVNAYLQAADTGKPTAHAAVIESDTGAGRPLGILAHVPQGALELLKPVAASLRAIDAGVIERRDTHVGSDIGLLEDRGVPAFAPMLDTRRSFHYHHTAADTLDKVNPDDLRKHVATLATLSWWLLDTPLALQRNPEAEEKEVLDCPSAAAPVAKDSGR
jgi:Zn-dependent M28 family amino/carboxypeptidase